MIGHVCKRALLALALVPLLALDGHAEERDLKREIETQRAAVVDLERLDINGVAATDVARLRGWLDEAWARYGAKEDAEARVLIQRSVAQAELIRQRIESSKRMTTALGREFALRTAKDRVERLRQERNAAMARKKALEEAGK